MQAQQQAGSQQAQQQQQMMQMFMQLGKGIIELSKHKDYFSETGQVGAFPLVQQAAYQLEELEKMFKQSQQQPQQARNQ